MNGNNDSRAERVQAAAGAIGVHLVLNADPSEGIDKLLGRLRETVFLFVHDLPACESGANEKWPSKLQIVAVGLLWKTLRV